MYKRQAKRLQATLGIDPIAARFGDAIFTVLLGFTSQEALIASARAVQASLETDPYRLHNGDFQLRISIGISIADPAKPEAALLKMCIRDRRQTARSRAGRTSS